METQNKSLGTIKSAITGIQYHDGKVRDGEKVFLEREHENVHDPNAIRVDNLDFKKVGYIPRGNSCWLAPLIDQGKIMADGRIPNLQGGEQNRYQIPLEIEIFLESKGADMFTTAGSITSPQRALHETILNVYQNIIEKCSDSITKEYAESLRSVIDRNSLPETILLLELLESKSAFNSERRIREILQRLKAVDMGKAVYQDGLTVFPLSYNSSAGFDFVSLDQVLKKKQAEIGEVDEHGDVSRVRISNKGKLPIFIPQGEMIAGAKQDRVVLVSTVVKGESTVILDVNCVEQSRWRYESSNFKSSYQSHPGLRKKVMSSFLKTGSEDDLQREVWDEVSACLKDTGICDDSGSLAKGMDTLEKKLKEKPDKIKLSSSSAGMLVMSGDKLLGVDLFDSAKTFSLFKEKLLKSYQVERLRSDKPEAKVQKSQARKILDKIFTDAGKISTHPLNSSVINIETDQVGKNVLIHEDQICHLTACELDEKL